MNFLQSKLTKKILACVGITALICLMTGPPGSPTAPSAGIVGSFKNESSFFGLFNTQRWVVFLILGTVVSTLAFLYQSNKTEVVKATAKVVSGPRTLLQHRLARRSTLLALFVLALVLPKIVTDAFWQEAMVSQIAIFVLLALGLNVVVGFAGLLDLGFVAFYAVGAYATAWATGALPLPPLFGVHINPFFAIPIAIVFAMVSGVILGIPTLRLRGDYLAIVTLGFGEIITLFANNLYGITGGALGTQAIPHFSFHVGPVNYIWNLAPVPYYYLTLGFVILFIVIFYSL